MLAGDEESEEVSNRDTLEEADEDEDEDEDADGLVSNAGM